MTGCVVTSPRADIVIGCFEYRRAPESAMSSDSQECCSFIHIKRNGGDGNFSTLKRNSVVILGKDESCDFRIQVPSVSARHASLRVAKDGKVYTSSLVDNAPVYLNGAAVHNEVLICNKDVLKVGTCSFRFEYSAGVLSPLQASQNTVEEKASSETPQKLKSPDSAKRGKENATPKNVSKTALNSSKENVPTPVIPRQLSLTKQASRRRSSLVSIPEQEEVVSTPKHTATGSAEKHVCTPVEQLTSRRSLRNASLVSILEEEEVIATPSPQKRKLEPASINETLRKSTRKSVSFGPFLSPEFFDKKLPPSTPIKAGKLPGGMRRSLPTLLSHTTKPSPGQSSTDCSVLTEPEIVSSTEEEEETEGAEEGTEDKGTQDTEEDEGAQDTEEDEGTQDTEEDEGIQDTKEDEGTQDTEEDEGTQDTEEDEGTQDTEEDEGTQDTEEDEGTQDTEEDEGTQDTEDDEGTQDSEDIEEDQRYEKPNVEYSMTGFEDEDDMDSSQVEGSQGDEHNVGGSSEMVPETSRGLPTPLRRGIEGKPLLRKTKHALSSPLKNEIEANPKLRKNIKQSLPTPIRAQIQATPVFRKTRRALPTSLSKAIRMKPVLRKTRLMLSTPLRNAILQKPSLKKTKKSAVPTPVRKDIEARPLLKKTKRSIPTPVRKDIETQPSLKKTKRSMPTPVRKDIETQPSLKKTKRSMPTPVRKDIETQPLLKKTKRSMPTPVRKDIETQPSLKKTKRSMPTPVRKDIETQPSLKKTKRSMPTPVRKDIETQPSLKKTKRSMPTPVRKDIETQPSLRKTKRSMPTPVRKDIEARPSLKKTKQSMPTPVRKDIETQPSLKKTKRSMPVELQEAIQAGTVLFTNKKSLPATIRSAIEKQTALRATKKILPAAIRDKIVQGVNLRATKKCMPPQLQAEIVSKPLLRQTRSSLPYPLRAQIQSGVELKKTKLALPVELRKEIEAGTALKHVAQKVPELGKKSIPPKKIATSMLPAVKQARKRAIDATDEAIETPPPAPPTKKRRMAAPTSPMAFSFNQFVKGTEGGVNLSGIHVLLPNSKVEFSASHVETAPAKTLPPSPPPLVCPQTEVGTSLFQLGIDDKPTKSSAVRAGRSRPATNARGRCTRTKPKVGSPDLGMGARRVTRSSVRQVSAQTAGDSEEKGVTTKEPLQAALAVEDAQRRKKAARTKTVGKVLEAIPEQPGPSAVTLASDETRSIQKQQDSDKCEEGVKAKEANMQPDKQKRSTRSLKQEVPVPAAQAEACVVIPPSTEIIEVDPQNSKPRRPTRSFKQLMVTPVKPGIGFGISNQGTQQPEPDTITVEPKRIKRSSKKAELAISLPQECAEENASSQHPQDKKLKIEQNASVDELPKKVTRSSKQTKATAQVSPQDEMASVIGQSTDVILDRKKGNSRVKQDTSVSDGRKTRRDLRSCKQDDNCAEQTTYVLEVPPNAKKCKTEQHSNVKSTSTRSCKPVDADVIPEDNGNVALETVSKQRRVNRSSKPSQTAELVLQQENRSELITVTIPKRATRSSKLK